MRDLEAQAHDQAQRLLQQQSGGAQTESRQRRGQTHQADVVDLEGGGGPLEDDDDAGKKQRLALDPLWTQLRQYCPRAVVGDRPPTLTGRLVALLIYTTYLQVVVLFRACPTLEP